MDLYSVSSLKHRSAGRHVAQLRHIIPILQKNSIKDLFVFVDPYPLLCSYLKLSTKTQILINKLENVQVEAARIVTGGTRLVSLSNLYIETGWEKLKDRTILFYKMSNNLTPQYLSNLIPQNFDMIHDHNTRHTSRIPPVRTRTSLYASYFIPSSV